MVDIDAAGLVEGDGERIGGGRDQRCGRRGDHPLAEDRPHAGEAAFEIVILNAGDQPAIGIVGERREVRPAMGFPVLAGLRVDHDRDDGVIDRPEAAHEVAVGDAQPELSLCPRLISRLRAQHIAYRFADRQQGADNLRVAGKDTATALAVADRNGVRLAIDDLHQLARCAEEIGTFLDGGAIRRGAALPGAPDSSLRSTSAVDSGGGVTIPAGNRSSASISKVSRVMPSLRGRQV